MSVEPDKHLDQLVPNTMGVADGGRDELVHSTSCKR